MLRVHDLSVFYGPIRALDSVSLTVAEGEIVCVLGANGAGKSTLLRAISGQVRAHQGCVELDGRRLDRMGPVEIVRRCGVVQCPEGRQLFQRLTVAENLELGATRRGLPLRRLRSDLEFLTGLFPVIGQRLGQRAGTLSGGEQQMVAVARSVLARPRLLLLDEPALGLSPRLSRELFQAFPEIAARGSALLLVEQNANAALGVARRGYLLDRGRSAVSSDSATLGLRLQESGGYLGLAVKSASP